MFTTPLAIISDILRLFFMCFLVLYSSPVRLIAVSILTNLFPISLSLPLELLVSSYVCTYRPWCRITDVWTILWKRESRRPNAMIYRMTGFFETFLKIKNHDGPMLCFLKIRITKAQCIFFEKRNHEGPMLWYYIEWPDFSKRFLKIIWMNMSFHIDTFLGLFFTERLKNSAMLLFAASRSK